MPEPRPTKAARREEARAEALRLREEQQRAARRQRTLAVSLLVVGLAVVAVLVAVILNQGGSATAGEEVQPTVSTDRGGVVVDADGVLTPPAEQVTVGAAGEDLAWPQGGFGEDVVVVSVYSDFMCPFCGLFEESNGALLEELVAAGEIVLDVHPVAILDRYSNGT
ncbi:MAG TPA: DsbA family protein, partial [Actinotalea sp.]|nr:DsbA family protein [Actinotalea sp.]